MKKKILLFSALAGIFYLSMSSYSSGPAMGGAGNRTGGPGSTGTCAAGGCHSASSNATMVALKLTDKSNNQAVTDGKYIPGRQYDVEVTVTHASLTKFGFQAEAVNGAGNDIGNITAAAGVHVHPAGGRTVAEHSSVVNGTTTHFTWTAPASGAGAATFHVMGNAVNGDGQTIGDVPSMPFSKVYAEGTVSVNDLAAEVSVKAFPNPVATQLTIEMKNIQEGTYALTAFDLSGKKLVDRTVNVNSADHKTSINTADWATGLYHVQIAKDGFKKVLSIVKQ